MRILTGRFHRKMIMALLTKERPLRPKKTDYWLGALTLLTVMAVGLYAGWFAGCSRTPMAATVVPLVLALITGLALKDPSFTKLLAIITLVASFVIGYDRGEEVDNPITVNQLLVERNISVSDAIFEELTLLDAQLLRMNLDSSRHNAVLYGVGARIVEDAGLGLDQQLTQLQHFRRQLRELTQ